MTIVDFLFCFNLNLNVRNEPARDKIASFFNNLTGNGSKIKELGLTSGSVHPFLNFHPDFAS